MSLEDAFGAIATIERLPPNPHTLLGLAAFSTIRGFDSDATGPLLIVRAQYRGDTDPVGLRGAQGQGRYYAFQTGSMGWRLVSVFKGNRYQVRQAADAFRVITHWHLSASESPATVYTWNGRYFENARSLSIK